MKQRSYISRGLLWVLCVVFLAIGGIVKAADNEFTSTQILDDELFSFGDDDDLGWVWDTGDTRLELRDPAANVLAHWTDLGTTGKLTINGDIEWTGTATGSATPTAHDLAGALHNADTLANLNSKISDATLYEWEADTGGTDIHRDNLPAMVGDSGSGGQIGAVPAPSAGDAAAGKVLKAGATWAVPYSSISTLETDTGVDLPDSADTAFTLTGASPVWAHSNASDGTWAFRADGSISFALDYDNDGTLETFTVTDNAGGSNEFRITADTATTTWNTLRVVDQNINFVGADDASTSVTADRYISVLGEFDLMLQSRSDVRVIIDADGDTTNSFYVMKQASPHVAVFQIDEDGIPYAGTALNALTNSSGELVVGAFGLTDPDADRLLAWDDTGGVFEWVAASGTGDVTGPGGGSTDNALVRFDGTGGLTIQDGMTIEDDSGNVDVAGTLTAGSGNTTITSAAGEILHAAIEQNSATDGQVLSWNNSGGTWEPSDAGSGDVSAGANITDHAVVRGDGGAKGVQDTGVLIDDSDNVDIPGTITAGSGDNTITTAAGLLVASLLDINSVTDDTSAGATDTLLIDDGDVKEITFANFEASLSFANLSDYASFIDDLSAETTIDTANDYIPFDDATDGPNRMSIDTLFSADPRQGQVWLSAQALSPTTSNGAADPALDANDTFVMAFDPDAVEYGVASLPIPTDYDNSTAVTCYFLYYVSSDWAAGDDDVEWHIESVAIGNSVAMNTSYGTAATVVDGWQSGETVDEMLITASTSMTIGGTASDANYWRIRVSRDATDATNDTCTADANLVGVLITYAKD